MESTEPKESQQPASEAPKEEPTATTTTTAGAEQPGEPKKAEQDGEKVNFTLAFKKQTFNVEFGLDRTIGDLRQEVAR